MIDVYFVEIPSPLSDMTRCSGHFSSQIADLRSSRHARRWRMFRGNVAKQ